jgi:hypothetical protein
MPVLQTGGLEHIGKVGCSKPGHLWEHQRACSVSVRNNTHRIPAGTSGETEAGALGLVLVLHRHEACVRQSAAFEDVEEGMLTILNVVKHPGVLVEPGVEEAEGWLAWTQSQKQPAVKATTMLTGREEPVVQERDGRREDGAREARPADMLELTGEDDVHAVCLSRDVRVRATVLHTTSARHVARA